MAMPDIISSEGDAGQQTPTSGSLAQDPNSPMTPSNPVTSTETSNSPRGESLDVQSDGLFPSPDDSFFDTTFDWFAWSNEQFS